MTQPRPLRAAGPCVRSTMGGSGLLVKSARSPGYWVVRSAAAGLGKLCNVCRHRCMGVTAWRESVAEWVGPIRHTERARIGATVQSCLCSWRGQLECNTGHAACTVCHVDNDKFVSSLQQRCVCGHLAPISDTIIYLRGRCGGYGSVCSLTQITCSKAGRSTATGQLTTYRVRIILY